MGKYDNWAKRKSCHSSIPRRAGRPGLVAKQVMVTRQMGSRIPQPSTYRLEVETRKRRRVQPRYQALGPGCLQG